MAHLTDAELRVLDAVDEPWLLARLRELVAVPSVGGTPAESDAQHLVAGWLRGMGADTDVWDVDLVDAVTAPDAPGQEVVREEAVGVVGTVGTGSGEPGLVLCGHTDVVPAGDRALWPGDPFAPRLEGGVLHGRGTCDMKGGLVAALAAARAVAGSGVRLARPLAVHSVVGEEDGGLGAWATLRRGHRGAACIIPEPTAGAVMTANAGALTFRITLTGLAAHGAMRDQGVSTVELWAELHAALRSFEASRQRDVDRFLGTRLPYGISIGTLHAGDWSSTVPDRLVAEGRFGVQVDEPVETARAALEAAVAGFCAGHDWLADHPARVEWVGGSFASGRLPEGSAMLPAVQDAVVDLGRARPAQRYVPAGTDLRLYAAAGVPTLHFGPGDLALAHAPREQVPVADVVHVARVLALTALRQCTVEA
ncbi:acetylornithine deacetylase [Klenkia soli]|uniref:Acetylornithine deacetylase n=1 Tax=Klenkia soli TaxID=1052260 RepID=A0A1H0JJV0_9ACTN|nr:ArgE/DapE family deacylase [Klenkia soli]SDO43904.1 acetylornithine deacetylase [Klenkia soli]